MTTTNFEVIGPGTKETDDPITLGLAYLLLTRVCGEGTPEEAEAWLRIHHPAGTTSNWHLSKEPHRQPVACGNDPKRTHFMFEC